MLIPVALGLLASGWVLAVSPFTPLPDVHAQALTGYAGYHPFRPVGTPLWGALVWILAQLPVPLSISVSFFQAGLAGVVAGCLARILIRAPIRRDRLNKSLPFEAEQRERTASALFGVLFLIASVSFPLAFAFPRQETLAFALLALALSLTVEHWASGSRTLLWIAAGCFGLSAVEHASAAFLAPLAVFISAACAIVRKQRVLALVLPAIGIGVGFGILAVAGGLAWYRASDAAAWRELASWPDALRLFWQDYMARGPRAVPRVGWLAIFAFTILPIPFLLSRVGAGKRRQFSMGIIAFRLIALPIIAIVILFHLPGAPLRVAQTESPLVLVYFLSAFWAGRLIGVLLAQLDAALSRRSRQPFSSSSINRALHIATITAVVVLCTVAGLMNRPLLERRAAQSAREIAHTIVQTAPDHEWILTTGDLDDHLLLAAAEQKKPLTIMNIRAAIRRPYQRYLSGLDAFFDPDWIRRAGFEPVFAQWLARSAESDRSVSAVASLDLFAPAGWALRPTSLAYRLVRLDEPIDCAQLERVSALLSSLEPLQKSPANRPPIADGFAAWRNAYLGRFANEVGVEWHALGETTNAQSLFEQAIRLDPSNPAPHINRLLVAQSHGLSLDDDAVQRARAALEPIVGTQGGVGFLMAFGRVVAEGESLRPVFPPGEEGAKSENPLDPYARLMAEGRDAEALALLDRVLQADPANVQALQQRFSMYIQQKQYASARADLAAMQRLGVPAWMIQLAEGNLSLAEDRLEEAAEIFRGLTLRHQAMPEAYLGLATALARAGRTEEWRRVLPDLERLAFNHPPSLIYLAQNAAANSDFTATRRYLSRAAILRPNDPIVLEALIRLDFAQRDSQGLIDRGAALLRLNPNHPLGWYALATGSALQEEWDQAVRAYEIAARLAPAVESLNDWGWALFKSGNIGEALRVYDRAMETYPQAPRVRASRGVVLLEAGRPCDAVSDMEAAVHLGATGDDLMALLDRARRECEAAERADRP